MKQDKPLDNVFFIFKIFGILALIAFVFELTCAEHSIALIYFLVSLIVFILRGMLLKLKEADLIDVYKETWKGVVTRVVATLIIGFIGFASKDVVVNQYVEAKGGAAYLVMLQELQRNDEHPKVLELTVPARIKVFSKPIQHEIEQYRKISDDVVANRKI